ncbi:MAG: (d)CMP kinase [Synergistaceae bacterium]|jgi:cytidylate kinase|nr:(d)CMP kinase [Synergistaceae bacterium]
MPPRAGKPVIVLDGPAGAGKSSVGREVARRLGLPFLDTGAIYRAITLFMLRDEIAPHDVGRLTERLRSFHLSFSGGRVTVCGEDVTNAIRAPEIDREVSLYSAVPELRSSILDIQRQGVSEGLVAEGRDMGTVVFPDADLKIFLTASPEARARRRYDERLDRGETPDYEEILEMVNRRDAIDSKRDIAPLKAACDAICLDTTGMSFEDVVAVILGHAARFA